MRLARFLGNLEIRPESLNRLPSAVSSDVAKLINTRIKRGLSRLEKHLKEMVKDSILNCEEFSRIAQTDARGEIGIPNPVMQRFEEIAQAVADSLFIVFRPFRGTKDRLSGRLRVFCSPIDYGYLYKLEAAYVGGERGPMFDWLRCLLEQGTEVCVADHQYLSRVLSQKSKDKYSRTGFGIMVERKGQGWRVPPELAGTKYENLISRGLTSRHIQSVIDREFKRLLF